MIVIDANLLIYATECTNPFHAKARQWWDATLSGIEPIGLPWESITAFLRITTNSRVFTRPATIKAATQHVQRWLDQPNVHLTRPTDRHWTMLHRLLLEGQCKANLVTDAQLAALTITHGATLCTTDRDFARFPGLKWTNPIEG